MFVPFWTPRSDSNKKLYRRKGGGGGGKGGGGSSGGSSGGKSSGSGGGSSSSGSSGSGGKSSSVPLSSGASNGKGSATSYGGGGGKASTITSGPFTGRTAGGGSRGDVFGGRAYGSGYPGTASRGVAGRGLPFYFWPVAWGGVAGVGGGAYLHNNEYGRPNNSSRPGGAMTQANFISSTSNTTFHLLADNSTVTSLISSIDVNCTSSLSSSSSTVPSTYNDSNPSSPQPESAVQYYRASSIVLTLDGYNNTGADSDTDNIPDTPLPTNIDTTLLNCLNQTIGLAAPLIDGAGVKWAAGPGVGAIGLFWVAWFMLGNVI